MFKQGIESEFGLPANRPRAVDIANPLDLPDDIAAVLIPFIVEVITFAHEASAGKWGLTDYDPGVRINVGSTETLTITEDDVAIVAVASGLSEESLPRRVQVEKRQNRKGFYPSVPGSIRIRIPHSPARALQRSLKLLRPALFKAISLAGRKGLSRSVRAGHVPDLVREIGRFVGASLPQPAHVSEGDAGLDLGSAPANSLSSLMEGALQRVTANRFERNAAARDQCIRHHGARCVVCDFSFGEVFGEVADGFIHVHHVTPVAQRTGRYQIDAVRDLTPVCPNCHTMLHRKDPPFTVDELRSLRR